MPGDGGSATTDRSEKIQYAERDVVLRSRLAGPVRPQYSIVARACSRSGLGVGEAEEFQVGEDLLGPHAGSHLARAAALLRVGAMACFITTSPTNVPGTGRGVSTR